MKKMVILLASIILLAATAAATVINFDDLTGQTSMPAGYGGINWDPQWFYWSWPQSPYTPSSPSTRIATHNYGGWMEFGEDVNFVGAYFSGAGTSCYFEGYDDGVLVDTSAPITTSATPQFLSANFNSVDKVNVVCDNFNYFSVDDVTFENEAVSTPESALAVAAIALLTPGMIYLARRKR